MNFSSVPNISFLGVLLRLPLRLIPKNLVVPIIQGPLRGKKWIVGSSTHGCWLGSYEFEKQHTLLKHLHGGDIFYDLGANVGFYTLLAAKLVGSAGRVYAFEPLPQNLNYLNQHITLNKFGNITVYDVAVSDRGGTLNFQTSSNASMGTLEPLGDLKVKAIALDQLANEAHLPAPTVMKIDIEGGEYAALKGATHLLQNSGTKLFLAVHSPALREQCTQLLQSLGYTVETLHNGAQEIADELFCWKP